MDNSIQKRVLLIVQELHGLTPADREQRIAELCDDPETREQVRRFLRQSEAVEQEDDVAETVDQQPTQSNSPVDVPPRTRFSTYEILEEISRGGMGVVYKARQANVNRIVALKLIRAGRLAGDEDIRRFELEARSAAQLDHPGIVPVYEAGRHDGQPFLSMAYVDGHSLSDHLRDGPLPPRKAASLVEQIAEAVQYAHGLGVVHRDLKPQNILLDGSGQPRVTDFGLAKQLFNDEQLTKTGEIMGTPAYMSPEQARGEGHASDRRTDIYSLGVILFELLTGERPFRGERQMLLLQILNEDPPSPRTFNLQVPRDLETICLKCLEKSPDRRFTSALELKQELRRFLDGLPIRSRPVARWERGWRWVKRNPGLSFGVALSLVVFVLFGLSIGLYLQRESVAAERDKAVAARTAETAARTAETTAKANLQRQSARLYMSRGKFEEAIGNLDDALKQFPNQPELQLLKVDCHLALGDLASAGNELTTIEKLPQQGSFAGTVAIRRADLLLRSGDADGAISAYRRAVALGVSGGELHYARGMLAETSLEALSRFQSAAAEMSFDLRAFEAEILMLTMLGRIDEAIALSESTERLFPDLPQIRQNRAVLLAIHGDPGASHELIDTIDLPEQRRNALSESVGTIQLHCSEPLIMKRGPQGNYGPDLTMEAIEHLLKNQLPVILAGLSTVQSGGSVFPPVIAKKFQGFSTELSDSIRTSDFDRGARLVAEILDVHPEGTLCLLQGSLLFAQQKFREAVPPFRRAATTPAVHPQVRKEALFGLAVCTSYVGLVLAREDGEAERARWLTEAAATIRELAAYPEWIEKAPHIFTPAAIHAKDVVLARQLWSIWERNAEPELEILWQRKMEIEVADGNWSQAIAVADHILKLHPGHVKAVQMRKQAVDELEALLKSSGKTPDG